MKYLGEHTKLDSSIEHTQRENSKIHIFYRDRKQVNKKLTTFLTISYITRLQKSELLQNRFYKAAERTIVA